MSRFICLILFFCTLYSATTIQDIDSVQQITTPIDANTLIVLDADETISRVPMVFNFEGDRQHAGIMGNFSSSEFPRPANLNYSLTEKYWTSFLKGARAQGAKVIIISSRDFESNDKLRLSFFEKLGFRRDELVFSGEKDGFKKDVTLNNWLRSSNVNRFNSIVFVDNLKKHCEEVANSKDLNAGRRVSVYCHNAYAKYFNANYQAILAKQLDAINAGKPCPDDARILRELKFADGPQLPWIADFESASVLPYWIDERDRTWVLLSKKTYKDGYDKPAWGDFGGVVEVDESSAEAAARELGEETDGVITSSEEELKQLPFHQIDMQNSPFGNREQVRRHTIYFKPLPTKITPTVSGAQQPRQDGSGEVGEYQWVLAEDLLNLKIPAIFGEVLGKYQPDKLFQKELRNTHNPEYFSVPFHVVLQQESPKVFLQRPSSAYRAQTFSQIVFNSASPFDWRVVHKGAVQDDATEKQHVLASDFDAVLSDEIEKDDGVKIRFVSSSTPPAGAKAWQISRTVYLVLDLPETFEPQKSQTIIGLVDQYVSGLREPASVLTQAAVAAPAAAVAQPALPMTMTEAHLTYFLNRPVSLDSVEAVKQALVEYKNKLMDPSTKIIGPNPSRNYEGLDSQEFAEAVYRSVQLEKENSGMYSAYHACSGEVHFLYAFYEVIGKLLGLPREVYWRAFDAGLPTDVEKAVADAAQSLLQENHYLNPHDLMVAANGALTGNALDNGCRTLTYWLKSASEQRLDLQNILDSVLRKFGITDENVKAELYDLFKRSYIFEQGGKQVKVGALRQIFMPAGKVNETSTVSGWYYDNPLDFSDKQLPDGTKVSAYAGLEEGENAWLSSLSPSERFMAHIRMGHSARLEENIRLYHRLVPNGYNPHNVGDYELRVLTAANPKVVSHFYPHRENFEENVKTAIQGIMERHLDDVEVPVGSYQQFDQIWKDLSNRLRKAGVKVALPPVDGEQFKNAMLSGDMKTMQRFLKGIADFSEEIMETVDPLTNKKIKCSVAECMAIYAALNPICAGYLETLVLQFPNLLNGVNFTNTPYALAASITIKGLAFFDQPGLQADTRLRIAFAYEDKSRSTRELNGGVLDITVSQMLELLGIVGFSNPVGQLTFLEHMKTDIDSLSDDLLRGIGLPRFLRMFAHDLTQSNWNKLIRRFGITEEDFYKRNATHLVSLFGRPAIPDWLVEKTGVSKQDLYSMLSFNASMEPSVFEEILSKLIKYVGKNAVLDHLDNLGSNAGLILSDKSIASNEVVRRKIEILNRVGLLPSDREGVAYLVGYPVMGAAASHLGTMVDAFVNGGISKIPAVVFFGQDLTDYEDTKLLRLLNDEELQYTVLRSLSDDRKVQLLQKASSVPFILTADRIKSLIWNIKDISPYVDDEALWKKVIGCVEGLQFVIGAHSSLQDNQNLKKQFEANIVKWQGELQAQQGAQSPPQHPESVGSLHSAA